MAQKLMLTIGENISALTTLNVTCHDCPSTTSDEHHCKVFSAFYSENLIAVSGSTVSELKELRSQIDVNPLQSRLFIVNTVSRPCFPIQFSYFCSYVCCLDKILIYTAHPSRDVHPQWTQHVRILHRLNITPCIYNTDSVIIQHLQSPS